MDSVQPDLLSVLFQLSTD